MAHNVISILAYMAGGQAGLLRNAPRRLSGGYAAEPRKEHRWHAVLKEWRPPALGTQQPESVLPAGGRR